MVFVDLAQIAQEEMCESWRQGTKAWTLGSPTWRYDEGEKPAQEADGHIQ